ncbi:retropepsin-like aspartic protease family protein [Methylobacter sp. YRD-M1]|uniref:retropepsin-like aspartic protease family protein n=1 Tax=Methylobacter sp. YRD-M1 TaxID=2911520 RepID=UPI00227BA92E|nr:retropepsin-like aspartic protease [Methylobacter sp. YRD-M1]WAK04589.1 retroviral-like aspartic protease family protein [Methylobacter sp. YRD-M1]
MGLQDRDYYRESYKRTPQENHNLRASRPRTAKRNNAGLHYLLYPVLTIAALWYGADYLLDKIKSGKLLEPSVQPANQIPLDLTPGSISLKTDRQGHFRGIVLVNNIPMSFMIDTGATITTIPAKMARSAGLPLGQFVQSSTAGGKVTDRVTRINSLKIGNAEIRNLEAHINEHLDEVLIGMNTLKYFRMTQSGNTLTLVANNIPEAIAATNKESAPAMPFPAFQPFNNGRPVRALAPDRPFAKPVTVKKTVACDEHQVCKTTYSDR